MPRAIRKGNFGRLLESRGRGFDLPSAPSVACAPTGRAPELSRRLDRFRGSEHVALTHRGCGSFGPIPNPAKHLLAHHEAEHLSGLDDEPSPRPGEVVWGRAPSHRNATAENK